MMGEKRSDLLIRKLYLSLIPVQALSVGLPAINNLINTFIVGNFIGTNGLAAMGLTGPLILLVTTISTMLASGSQLLCGRYLGEGNREKIDQSFSTAMILSVLFSLPLVLACVLAPAFVARILGAVGAITEETAGYVQGYGVGIAFSVLSSCILPFLQLARAEKTSSLCVSVMVAVNIVCNLLNVFVLHWGVFGAGLAISAANFCMVLTAGSYFRRKNKIFRFSLRGFSGSVAGMILYQGFPAAVNPVCVMLRNRVMNQFLLNLGGTVAISAVTIAINFSDVFGMLEGGYSGSGRMLASVLAGERDRETLERLPHIMIRSASYLPLAGYVLTFLLAKPISLLLGAEPEYIETYVMAVRLFNLWFVTCTIQSPPLRIYQGIGEVKLLSVLYLLNCLVYPVGLCLLLGNTLGIPLVMSLPWLAELITILTHIIYYTVRSGHRPPTLVDLTYLPPSLSAEPENVFTASARTVEDTVAVSEAARNFCLQKGVSERTSYFCALCVEEVVSNVILHGFTKGKRKDYSADVRLICEDGELSLLIRDDCVHFDPNEWLSLCTSDDPLRGIGIRMVKGLAKEMNYNSSLGLNVLTIKL